MAANDEQQTVNLRDRGQMTVPKDIREDYDTSVFAIDTDDDGRIVLTPLNLEPGTAE